MYVEHKLAAMIHAVPVSTGVYKVVLSMDFIPFDILFPCLYLHIYTVSTKLWVMHPRDKNLGPIGTRLTIRL